MEFLSRTQNIRNICILAHVDHGKTTIADSLIASNGIISQRMAGKMRYMDNRQDEQERGITMKSSSIALKYCNQQQNDEQYLINLIDTPGHVDFCGEVSTAVRLCDGALIVVDVVEGICPQTKAAIEQAWKEGIEPILVLNKIDRLILEQKLDETSAYLRLNQLLEQVNVIVATLLNTEVFEGESNQANEVKLSNTANATNNTSTTITSSNDNSEPSLSNGVHIYDWASGLEDIDDDKYYFMPEKNNVVFASSIDDWAFTIESFAKIFSNIYKINETALQKTLWGDFYVDTKQKRILKNAQAKAKKNLFTSMICENIWKIYDIVCVRRDKIRMEKMCNVLGIELTQRDLNHNDSRYQVKMIMSKWIRLSQNVLKAVTKIVPSPKNLNEKRVERLLSSSLRRFKQMPPETQALKKSFISCSSEDNAIKVACVSKMFPFERKNLPENRRNLVRRPVPPPKDPSEKRVITYPEDSTIYDCSDKPEEEIVFIAFARIFSGKMNKGDKIYVLGPRHDPSLVTPEMLANIDEKKLLSDLKINEHVTIATVENFYLLMGREVEEIDYALAGNVVGISGLDKHLIRTATLSSDIYCPPFNDLHLPVTPILRVAIEPKNPLEMQTLVDGLKLLNQADPCVEVKLQESGEHVIIATGEVHLQHCIKDLREMYANNIELNVSAPIVPFRETIVLPPKTDMVNEAISNQISANPRKNNKQEIAELMTANKRCLICIKANPIPEEVIKCMLSHAEDLKVIAKLLTMKHKTSVNLINQLSENNLHRIQDMKKDLKTSIDKTIEEFPEWRFLFSDDFVERIWAFGPKYSGPNILVADKGLKLNYSLWTNISTSNQQTFEASQHDELSKYIDSFISGFQLAAQSGPLCEEPMMGVCFTVISWNYLEPEDGSSTLGSDSNARDNYGPMSGQIISTVKECCRKAFQLQHQRLMSPMFSCDIQVTSDVLGKMYAVLGRRNGRIIHGDMREGSQTFDIKAFIPVIESLDFVSEIRKQTSGMAYPQLIFSHYEIIDVDPFWTPTTEEEYALFGEKADTENQARKYMNLVRRRKGLSVQEKIVEHGEKQRTIKRNK